MNIHGFLCSSLEWLHSWESSLIRYLEFQERKYQPIPITQPKKQTIPPFTIRTHYKKTCWKKLGSFPFPAGTDSRRAASPPVEIFAGGAGEDAFYKRLHHGMWLFHLHSALKIQTFYLVFPLAESIADVFCRLFLWSCKEKNIYHF